MHLQRLKFVVSLSHVFSWLAELSVWCPHGVPTGECWDSLHSHHLTLSQEPGSHSAW